MKIKALAVLKAFSINLITVSIVSMICYFVGFTGLFAHTSYEILYYAGVFTLGLFVKDAVIQSLTTEVVSPAIAKA